MKISVDRNLCEGNGVCVGMAPDVFDLDYDDYVHVLIDPIPDERVAILRQVARTCPRSAIKLS
jgi:ferredoxin